MTCRIRLVCFIYLPVVLASLPCLGLDLVKAGKPVATIVIPDDPLPVVSFAAEELNYHLKRATGTVLPVVAEKKAPDNGALVILGSCRATVDAGIGTTALEPNTWILKLKGNRFLLAGDDSDGPAAWILHGNRTRVGTLFAVYQFLERHLGVKWLWPGELGEVIPPTVDVTVDQWDEVGRPPFVHTRWREGGGMMSGTAGWSLSAARSRFINEQGKWLRRHRFAMGRNMDMAHAFTAWWTRHGETHPEYFNLLPDGFRRSDPLYHGGSPKLISMSVGHPAFQEAVVQHWLESRRPDKPWIDCSENDTSGRCLCQHCLALDEPDPALPFPWEERLQRVRDAYKAGDKGWTQHLGSLSDRYARYYRAVLGLARKHDPDAVVMGYAYANYVDPPRNTSLNDHVIIGLVPPLYYPWTDAKREANRDRWLGWAKTGARLFLRPNWMLDGHNMPLFFARKLGEDFRFYAAHGLIGTDFDSLTGQYASQGPNLYTLARLQGNPSMPVDQVLDEYMSAFGPAKQSVWAYFSYLEKVADAPPEDPIPGLHWSYFYREAHVIFTPAVMDHAEALLKDAAGAAAGDERAARRVSFLQHGLTNAALTLAVQRAFTHHREHGDLEGYRDALERLDTFRHSVESELVGNLCFLNKREGATWDRALLRLMKQPGTRLSDPWQFHWDVAEQGEQEGWSTSDLDDSGWSTINTDGPWEQQTAGRQWKETHNNADYDGVAWYRKSFAVPRDPADSVVRLVFGAVDEACTVWVNGHRLLDRPYPFQGNTDSWREAFEVDITDAVRDGQRNTVAVRVSDHAGAGGIWRPVWLTQFEPPVAAAENLVACPGFEASAKGWGRSTMAGEFSFAFDTSHAHSGGHAGRLQCTARGTPDVREKHKTDVWGRWYQTGLPVNPERTYRLRLWVRASTEPMARVSIWVTGTKQKTMSANLADTGGRWVEATIGDIHPAGDTVAVYLNLRDAPGTVWFDDVELVLQRQ
ncbi:MAG: DUF4838 domain-containing protein [Lentisphaerae bacterium]|nr:DUF4838 domain-containing protein [Lentisphaerota bacterium]MBT5605937.1 DUF4838 domain-containing protein [Lentisphaerota bacterium]MBT7058016.1 DUF4838 domain-containing protein [Lentisphaerota bacterium]MBT7848571.1 DUF4838 domain-containing protein [Lentisphaerota bacterium]